MSNTDLVCQFYDAINRNDMDSLVQHLDPGIVRVEFEDLSTGGAYRGIEEVRAHVAKGRGTWAEGACEPEEFTASGDRVVVAVHVKVRLADAADWIDGRITDAFVLRGGKIVEFRSFTDRTAALSWAGIKE